MDDDTIVLDLPSMTLGELEVVEEIAGLDGVQSMMFGPMTPKALIAAAYVVKRRDHPDFTLEDARAVKVMALKHPEPDAVGKANGNSA